MTGQDEPPVKRLHDVYLTADEVTAGLRAAATAGKPAAAVAKVFAEPSPYSQSADPLAAFHAAVQKIEALPRPPRCVVMNPADLDAMPRSESGGAMLPRSESGGAMLPALGVPVFTDPDVPVGRPEFRDEYPAPKGQP